MEGDREQEPSDSIYSLVINGGEEIGTSARPPPRRRARTPESGGRRRRGSFPRPTVVPSSCLRPAACLFGQFALDRESWIAPDFITGDGEHKSLCNNILRSPKNGADQKPKYVTEILSKINNHLAR